MNAEKRAADNWVPISHAVYPPLHVVGEGWPKAGVRTRAERTSLWLVTTCLAAALAACSSPPPKGNLQYIEQDEFRIGNPSADRALATGIGCGFTLKDAESKAQETAQFNLRRITGDARYRVEFTRLREVPDPKQQCVELQARAVPPRLR